jgi:hypothetical protein
LAFTRLNLAAASADFAVTADGVVQRVGRE